MAYSMGYTRIVFCLFFYFAPCCNSKLIHYMNLPVHLIVEMAVYSTQKLPPYVDLTNEKDTDDEPYDLETELRYSVEPLYERQDLSKPMVFVCVTMWHEPSDEPFHHGRLADFGS